MASLTDFTRLILKHIRLAAYPVGAYYWSSVSTDPGELFGGTWKQVTGKFIYACDDSHAAGSTGGTETHTLSTSELPPHAHESGQWVWVCSKNFNSGSMNIPSGSNGNCSTYDVGKKTQQVYTLNTGGGQAFSIMPPYEAAYCWKRTA